MNQDPSSPCTAAAAAPLPSGLDVVHALDVFRRRGVVVALDSAGGGRGGRARSWVAGAPLAELRFEGGRWRVVGGRRAQAFADLEPDPFRGLSQAVARLEGVPLEPGSPAGAFGFFGYECAEAPELPRTPLPDASWILTDTVVEWDREGARLFCPDPDLRESLLKELRTSPRLPDRPAPAPPEGDDSEPLPDWYRRRFARVREALRDGNSYQLCLTHQLERAFGADPLTLYRCLREENPAPFAGAVLERDFSILSSSPERFLSVDPAGRVEAWPMKGTAPRHHDPARDAAAREALLRSAKDRAENLMIADLLRNDLGRVCALGSVEVAAAAELHEFETVYQMVSRIGGQLAEGRGPDALLRSCFPPGSMTGAPKRRSVELLREIEAEPRGPYAGLLGTWRPDGSLDSSVLIRTWVLRDGVARAGVGGGVVWDSRLEAEWEECQVKARPLRRALARASRS